MLHTCAESKWFGISTRLCPHLDASNSDGQELELQASAGMYTRLDGRYSRIPLGQLKSV